MRQDLTGPIIQTRIGRIAFLAVFRPPSTIREPHPSFKAPDG